MRNEPQIAATKDKNYFLAITPLIFTAAVFFNNNASAMSLRPYIDLTAQPKTTPTRTYSTNTWSESSHKPQQQQEDSDANTPKASDKKVVVDDQDVQSNMREAVPLWELKSLNYKSWSEHVYQQLPTLGPDLLTANPADAKIFCPNYKNLTPSERKQFWAFFISSMAKFESNFNTQSAYTESFRDNSGRYVVSRGLLQISMESSKGYKCGFNSSTEIYSATKNLSCGIKILNHWMKRDNRIASQTIQGWRGGARYWAVLRAGNKESYRSIVKWSNGISFCKL